MAESNPASTAKPVLTRQISQKSFVGHYVGLIFVAIVALAIANHLEGGGQWLVGLGGLLAAGGGVGVIQLVRSCTNYRIYDDRIELETGVISKNLENLKLFRIRDIGLHQGVLGRIFGFGDISITATDTTAPHLRIDNVDAPKEVYDQISALMNQAQALRRTMIVEDMPMAEGEASHQ